MTITQINHDITIIKTIFHWYSSIDAASTKFSPHSHCLLRIYINKTLKNAVVIASQLYSNEGNTGIYYGFLDLATTAIAQFPELAAELPHVIWLAHYGYFSEPNSYTTIGTPERFRQINLTFDSTARASKVSNSPKIKASLVSELISGFSLEPVEQVLTQLKYDKNFSNIQLKNDENFREYCN